MGRSRPILQMLDQLHLPRLPSLVKHILAKNQASRGRPQSSHPLASEEVTGTHRMPIPLAELVAVGCRESSEHIRGDSPTACLLTFHIICSCAARFQWPLRKLDATSAYLQGDAIDRTLLLSAPKCKLIPLHHLSLAI